MVYERSPLAGDTDYTGVSMQDILLHLEDWRRNTDAAIEKIKHGIQEVKDQNRLFADPEEVVSFGEYFIDLFSRYRHDIDRLIAELPQGVTQAHIEIVDQICRSSRYNERLTVEFKQDLIQRRLPHEEARPILDDIYRNTRGRLVDFRDFSNLVPRLRTFISASPPSEVLPEIELKPNIYGIGVNLNRCLCALRNGGARRSGCVANRFGQIFIHDIFANTKIRPLILPRNRLHISNLSSKSFLHFPEICNIFFYRGITDGHRLG